MDLWPCSRGVLVVRLWVVGSLALGLFATPVLAECVDPSTLVRSTASITRYFDKGERGAGPLGIRGTAWFSSPTTMVTAEHVASAMKLSEQAWKTVELVQGEATQSVSMRLRRIDGSAAERIAILELSTAYAEALGLQLRTEPLVAEERVVGLAYPKSHLRFATGRFVRYSDSDANSRAALFEMFDGDDRLVLDHGASGAAILDCSGRVVAVVSNLFTQTIETPFRPIRISTAWGQPNVVSIPIEVLKEFQPTRH
jgi:hypothetical protein